MIRVVLDTNILVSGLLSTFGNSAEIINAITDRVIACFYSDAIIREYTDVLLRPKFGFPQEKADALISPSFPEKTGKKEIRDARNA